MPFLLHSSTTDTVLLDLFWEEFFKQLIVLVVEGAELDPSPLAL